MSSSREADAYYNTHGRARRSPPGADQIGGLFQTGQGGRPVLPPISSAFPTSRSPAPVGQYTNQARTQRSSPGRDSGYGANQYNTQQWTNQPSQHPTTFDYYAQDTRYATTPSSHTPYHIARTSPHPPTDPHDVRRLPPISRREENWQQSSYAPPGHMAFSDEIHSPTASYPPQFPGYQMPMQDPYAYHRPTADPNHPQFAATSYPQSPQYPTGIQSPTERSAGSRANLKETQHPYARYTGTPQSMGYGSEASGIPTPVEEPVKKKRKRADAAQLKVLNETYQRTAFPSTEERQALAVELDMPPRSVQIWFQNKRQSDRQSSRQPAAAVTSSSARQPFVDPSTEDTPLGGYGSGGSSLSPTSPSGNMYLPRSSRDSSHYRARSHEESGDPRKLPSRRY